MVYQKKLQLKTKRSWGNLEATSKGDIAFISKTILERF